MRIRRAGWGCEVCRTQIGARPLEWNRHTFPAFPFPGFAARAHSDENTCRDLIAASYIVISFLIFPGVPASGVVACRDGGSRNVRVPETAGRERIASLDWRALV